MKLPLAYYTHKNGNINCMYIALDKVLGNKYSYEARRFVLEAIDREKGFYSDLIPLLLTYVPLWCVNLGSGQYYQETNTWILEQKGYAHIYSGNEECIATYSDYGKAGHAVACTFSALSALSTRRNFDYLLVKDSDCYD